MRCNGSCLQRCHEGCNIWKDFLLFTQQYKAAFKTTVSVRSNYNREKLRYVIVPCPFNFFVTITSIERKCEPCRGNPPLASHQLAIIVCCHYCDVDSTFNENHPCNSSLPCSLFRLESYTSFPRNHLAPPLCFCRFKPRHFAFCYHSCPSIVLYCITTSILSCVLRRRCYLCLSLLSSVLSWTTTTSICRFDSCRCWLHCCPFSSLVSFYNSTPIWNFNSRRR